VVEGGHGAPLKRNPTDSTMEGGETVAAKKKAAKKTAKKASKKKK
jgi:hypothetical protein